MTRHTIPAEPSTIWFRSKEYLIFGEVMKTRQITVRVTPEAAIYDLATEQVRRKLDVLISLRLSEAAGPSRSLKEIMRDASQEAQERGLTEDILKELLDEQ